MSEPSIGIDLGTTNSAVASLVDGQPRIIERSTGQRLLPSMVAFSEGGERLVGEAARALTEILPENVAYATKRFMGQRWTPELANKVRALYPFTVVAGPNEDVRVRVAGRTLPVVEIAAAVLGQLRADAEAFFGREVHQAVITVPANFNDAQRQATKEAAKIAGLEVLRLINEPTAAALAYGLSSGFQGRALVFDLGGGTFDVTVLEVRDGVFEVIATGGDPFLGGEDFDNMLVQWLIAQISDAPLRERASKDKAALQKLKAAAEHAKIAISTTEQARISTTLLPELRAQGGGISLESMLTRGFFERLARPLVERCLSIVNRTLIEAGIASESIGKVMLVGGMTRMPLLRTMVAERFGQPPATNVNPDEVVALGAAIQAAELSDKVGKVLLLDVVSSTLSVGIAGGTCKPLIRKNSSLPRRAAEIFHPSRDGQTLVRIPVVQGESSRSSENFLLGELTLGQLPVARRGDVEIEIGFEMGTDGILAVSAKDVATGHAESVRLVARTDLPASELERLQEKEKGSRDGAALIEQQSRERSIKARTALREVATRVRKLHRELTLAAQDNQAPEAHAVVEALGRRLVEAEQTERSGSIDEVEAKTMEIKDVLVKLVGA